MKCKMVQQETQLSGKALLGKLKSHFVGSTTTEENHMRKCTNIIAFVCLMSFTIFCQTASAAKETRLTAYDASGTAGQVVKLKAMIESKNWLGIWDSTGGLTVKFYVNGTYAGSTSSSSWNQNASLDYKIPSQFGGLTVKWYAKFEGNKDYNPSASQEKNLVVSKPPNRPPYKPQNLRLDSGSINETSAKIKWDAATDPDGDTLKYRVEYGRNDKADGWNLAGETSNIYYTIKNLVSDKPYDVRVCSIDSKGAQSEWNDSRGAYPNGIFRTKPIHSVNSPEKPSASKTSFYYDEVITFKTSGGKCSWEHAISSSSGYRFVWGDGTTSTWGGDSRDKKFSGDNINGSKKYNVTAQARCSDGLTSPESPSLEVTVKGRPNLVVTEIKVSKNTPLAADDKVDIIAKVKNIGNAKANPPYIDYIWSQLKINGKVVDHSNGGTLNYIWEIEINEERTVKFTGITVPTTAQMLCEVIADTHADSGKNNRIPESAEGDNSSTFSIPVNLPGSISVAISPTSAINSGAKWKATKSGHDTGWQDSGAAPSVPVGDYTISFNMPSSWNSPSGSGAKPADITNVSVSSGGNVQRTGTYMRIVSAVWNTSNKTVIAGTLVPMRAVVEGFASGTQFSFTINESDPIRRGTVYSGSSDSNGVVTAQWLSVGEDDWWGDPEFSFTVRNASALNDMTPTVVSRTSPDDLTVQEDSTSAEITAFTFPELPANKMVKPGDMVKATVTIKNTGNRTRSFWVGLSFESPLATGREWPSGWLNVPAIETSVALASGASETISFTYTIPDDVPIGSYNAVSAIWDGFDGQQMLEPQYDSEKRNDAFIVSENGITDDPYGLQALDAGGLYAKIKKGNRRNLVNLAQTLAGTLKDANHEDVALSSSASHVAILIHGWNPSYESTGFGGAMGTLVDNLTSGKLPSNWSLVKYEWPDDAATGHLFGGTRAEQRGIGAIASPFLVWHVATELVEANAIQSAERGYQHGIAIGKRLVEQVGAGNLKQVHLLGHSAGSWAVYAALRYLRVNSPDTQVQVTYLDPFIPDRTTTVFTSHAFKASVLEDSLNYTNVTIVGAMKADGYYSKYHDMTNLAMSPRFSTEIPWIWEQSKQGCVFLTDYAGAPTGWYGHSGPVKFYADTVTNPDRADALGHGWKHSLAYNGKPAIRLTPGSLDFGEVVHTSSKTLPMTIWNDGDAILHVDGISHTGNPPFSGTWSGEIQAGGSRQVDVTFGSAVPGTYTSTLTVMSNAAMSDSQVVCRGTLVVEEADDIVPDQFTFTDQTDVARSTVCTSNTITVSGINAPAEISIFGNDGEYQINRGSWIKTRSTVSNGNTVKVRQKSSDSFSTPADTKLTIGDKSDTFTVTTVAAPSAPTITSLNPTHGPASGGNSVIITGTNFTDVTAVKFGAVTVNTTNYTVNSPTQITATAPAGTAGSKVDVSVTTKAGTSPNTTADDYTYDGNEGFIIADNIFGAVGSTGILRLNVHGNPSELKSFSCKINYPSAILDFQPDPNRPVTQTVKSGLTSGFAIAEAQKISDGVLELLFVHSMTQGDRGIPANSSGIIGEISFTIKGSNQNGSINTFGGDLAGHSNISFSVTNVLPGDANLDGHVTVMDILKILDFIWRIETATPSQAQAADMNNDGNVTVLDVLAVLNSIWGVTRGIDRYSDQVPSLHCNNISGAIDQIVDVEIYLDLTSQELKTFSFKANYPIDVLEFVNDPDRPVTQSVNCGLTSDFAVAQAQKISNGFLELAFVHSLSQDAPGIPARSNGLLCKIKFKIIGTAHGEGLIHTFGNGLLGASNMQFYINAQNTATLTMDKTGNGTVTPALGAHEVPLNTPRSITATADANSHFVNWTVTGGATVADANSATTTVTLTADGTVTANFAENAKYSATVVNGTGDGDYYAGETVNIIADAAGAGEEFSGWTSADGVNFANAAAATTTFVMPAKAVTVTATYRATVATLTMAKVGNGAVTPALGGHEVPLNVPQGITAQADNHSHFVNWTVTGGATVADPNAATTTVALTAAGTVTANFAEDVKYSVTVVNGTGDGDYYAGETVTIAADAAQVGQEFDVWTSADGVNFANATAATTTFVMPAKAVMVTANYRATDATLTMAVVGQGTVTPALGAHDDVPLNVAQTITAVADANWHFVNWTATGGATVADANAATTTVTLTAAGTVTANFVDNTKYLVTVEKGTGDGDYYAGETVTITADAAPAGKRFTGWTSLEGVAFANAAAPTTTFVMPANNVTVTATYQPITYTITLVSRRGVLADATGWVFADNEYTRTFAGVLADAVDFPAVAPAVPADWEFAQWTVTAYDGTAAAYASGQVLAQLPAGFTGNIELEAGFRWIGPNPSPWYPVYDLGCTAHAVHQVDIYRGEALVAGLVVRGAQVKPVDYLNAGCPGLKSGVEYSYEVSAWNSGVLCHAPEAVTPEYQLPEIGTVVAGQPDADNVVELAIDLPMASKYLLTIFKGNDVYFRTTEFVFATANEEGFILPNTVRPMEFFTAGTYDIEVLAINPMGEAAQAATCQVVIAQPVAPATSWPVAGFTPAEGQNILLSGNNTPVIFSWPAIVQAEVYDLLVYDGNGNNVATQSDFADCHATVMMSAGVYFWRVVAVSADGRELSSAGQNFAIVADSNAPIISRAGVAVGKPNAVVLFCDPASSNYAGVSYEIQFYTAASGWVEFMGNARKAAVFTDGDLDGVYECELDLGVPVSGGYLLIRSLVNGQPLNDSFVLFRVP